MRWTLARHSLSGLLAHSVLVSAIAVPAVWMSGQASGMRTLLVPGTAILALALLIAREPWSRKPASGADSLDGSWIQLLSRSLSSAARSGPTLPALLYMAWAVIGTLTTVEQSSPTTDLARGELLRLGGNVAVFLYVSRAMRSWERARLFVGVLLWMAVGATTIALLSHRADESTLSGAFGNPQLLAAFLLLLSPIAVALAGSARNPRRRLLAQLAAVMAIAGLGFCQTRSAWIGAIVGLALLGCLLARLPRRRGRRDLRPALAAGLIAFGGTGWLACQIDLAGPLLQRAATLARLGDDEGAGWRVRQWRIALSLSRDRPVIGHGLGTFPIAAAPRFSQPISTNLVAATGPNLSLNAHSLYLQTLVESGLIGLALYLWMVTAFLSAGFRFLRRLSTVASRARQGRSHRDERGEDRSEPALRLSRSEIRSRFLVLAACLSAVAGSAVDAMANPGYQFVDVSLLFWTILGLGTAMTRFPTRAAPPAAQSRRVPYVMRFAAALAGTGVLLAGRVAGSSLPANTAEYMPFQSLRVQALTTPGYLTATLLPGECVEMRAMGRLQSGEELDATAQCDFARAGGTAPEESLEQIAAPHGNLFCLAAGAPASYDGRTVLLQGTLNFNGRTLTSLGPPLILSVPRACPGVSLIPSPRVLPATGGMVEVRVRYVEGDVRFQRLHRVESNEPLSKEDVRILSHTHVLLRAVSTIPGRRIYTLHYRFLDRRGLTWSAPVQVYVR
jgi:putative inorganic carbon (HCO3(-)) transporter